jgi:hypothetical protein
LQVQGQVQLQTPGAGADAGAGADGVFWGEAVTLGTLGKDLLFEQRPGSGSGSCACAWVMKSRLAFQAIRCPVHAQTGPQQHRNMHAA